MKKVFYVIGNKEHHHDVPEKPYSDEAGKDQHNGTSNHFDRLKALEIIKQPRWTAAQIEEATRTKSFPEGTTIWDKFVAYNSFYDDLKGVYTEEDILKGAYAYFFADVDAPPCKIWHYMKGMGRM